MQNSTFLFCEIPSLVAQNKSRSLSERRSRVGTPKMESSQDSALIVFENQIKIFSNRYLFTSCCLSSNEGVAEVVRERKEDFLVRLVVDCKKSI